MATKAKTTTKSKTKSTSARKATARVASSTKVVASTKKRPQVSRLAVVTPQALVAEAVGTFGLALAALTAPADQPLLVGLALAVLLVGMMRISGGHFNPAVTFGLWALNKLDAVKLPFYWIAQVIGGLAAVLVLGSFNGSSASLDFSNFAKWDWLTFWAEFIGTALFLFGLVATLKNVSSSIGRSFGIGLSLAIGLVVAGGLLTANATFQQADVQSKAQSDPQNAKYTQTIASQGAALNPAIALVQTERDVDGINKSLSQQSQAAEEQKKPSHFTLPVVLGSLVGAAAGANLYLVLAGLSWKKRDF